MVCLCGSVIVVVWLCVVFFFFFQAEDGIRDIGVTGVQTCALPIYCILGLQGNVRSSILGNSGSAQEVRILSAHGRRSETT